MAIVCLVFFLENLFGLKSKQDYVCCLPSCYTLRRQEYLVKDSLSQENPLWLASKSLCLLKPH
ncbi:hypothetical protein ACHAXS_001846 [Conticribra weissflogii]